MKFKSMNAVLVLVLLLSGFAASAAPALASSGGGNQIYYPAVGEVMDIAVVDSNLWIATGFYSSGSLIWANAETGRWAPQNRTATSVDARGRNLWVVSGEVSLFDGSSWTTWSTWTAQAKGQATQIRVDSTGHPWLVSSNAISRYNGTEWQRICAEDYYQKIAPVSANEAWMANGYSGLRHVIGSTTKTFRTADGLVSDKMVTVAFDAASGYVWAGSSDRGISYGNGANWTSLTTSNGLRSNPIRYLEVGNGSIWIAYANQPGTIARYTTGNGISHLELPPEFASNLVTRIRAQAPETLWVGLDNSTILRYVNGAWAVVTTMNGPAPRTTSRVFSVAGKVYSNGWEATSAFDGAQWQKVAYVFTTGAELGANNYWLGTSTGYLHHSTDGNIWQSTYLGSNVRVTHIALDTQSSLLWLGTDSGLWRYNPATGTVVNKWYPATEVSASGNYVRDLEVTPGGAVWLIGSANSWTGGTIARFDPASNAWSAFNQYASGVAQTSTGDLWFSTVSNWQPRVAGSLLNFDGGTWSVYTQTHGLPWGSVYDVAVDANDRVWTAGYGNGNGLSEFDNGEFDTYRIPQSISGGIWLNQQNGDLWVPTYPEGVLRFNADGLVSTAFILAAETVVESPDGSGQVLFPSGVLPEGTEVSIRSDLSENSGVLKGKSSVLEINWNVPAQQALTTETCTITLSYIKPTVGIYVPNTFGLYRWDTSAGVWQMMDAAIHNPARMEFSAGVSAPGKFQIMGRTYDVFLPLTLRQ
ncbi:MAG: hypothetical protein BWY63_01711 [Chloroflexi bacterium ADurb.Bin360]|nr:MAG: hypothetical protein BWY63_01711 [Chloroflexi bacterium ADurb.Bin360]